MESVSPLKLPAKKLTAVGPAGESACGVLIAVTLMLRKVQRDMHVSTSPRDDSFT